MNYTGQYYSNNYTTSGSAGRDIFADMRAELAAVGHANITAKKLTLISPVSITVDINGLGAYSALWQNADGDYILNLNSGDMLVSSLKVGTSASPIFMSVIF